MHMPATLQALNTQANQLIMRCDIAFEILQAVSAKSHHIDIWECLSVVIWERLNGMLGSNSNTWIEVKAGWLVSPPWCERAGYQCSSLTPRSWHLSWRAQSVALPPVWSVPPVWAECMDHHLHSGYAVKLSKRKKKRVNSYTNEKPGNTWLMFFKI